MDITVHWKVNYPFIWNPLVESCGSLILPPLDFSLERNLFNVICFVYFFKFFWNVASHCHWTGRYSCSQLRYWGATWFFVELSKPDFLRIFLFEFQNRIFLDFFVTSFKTGFSSTFLFQFRGIRTWNRSKFEGPLLLVVFWFSNVYNPAMHMWWRSCRLYRGEASEDGLIWTENMGTWAHIRQVVCCCKCRHAIVLFWCMKAVTANKTTSRTSCEFTFF
jgi:hypothetical protein